MRESIVQLIGVVVFVAVIALTVAAVLYELGAH